MASSIREKQIGKFCNNLSLVASTKIPFAYDCSFRMSVRITEKTVQKLMFAGIWHTVKLLGLAVMNVLEHYYAALAVLILTIYVLSDVLNLQRVCLSTNNVLKTVFSCFINSDFTEFRMLYGIFVMNMRLNEITHDMYEHFKISSLY